MHKKTFTQQLLENCDGESKKVTWTTNYNFSEKESTQGCQVIEWERLFSTRGFLNSDENLTQAASFPDAVERTRLQPINQDAKKQNI